MADKQFFRPHLGASRRIQPGQWIHTSAVSDEYIPAAALVVNGKELEWNKLLEGDHGVGLEVDKEAIEAILEILRPLDRLIRRRSDIRGRSEPDLSPRWAMPRPVLLASSSGRYSPSFPPSPWGMPPSEYGYPNGPGLGPSPFSYGKHPVVPYYYYIPPPNNTRAPPPETLGGESSTTPERNQSPVSWEILSINGDPPVVPGFSPVFASPVS